MEKIYEKGLKRAYEQGKLSSVDFHELFGARYFMDILNRVI